MSLLLRISPRDLGLPRRFTDYRPGQAEAIDFALSSDRRFTGLCAPTGIGKSLIGMTTAKTLDVKACYLTVTKGLQGQIQGDFAPSGLVDVRGRANYKCRAYIKQDQGSYRYSTSITCDDGAERGCSLQSSPQCPYFSAYVAACQSDLVSTNYAYWLHMRRSTPNSLGPVELLICDEAHAAFDQLASFLSVTVPRDDYRDHPALAPNGSGLMSDRTGNEWRDWAASHREAVKHALLLLADAHGSLPLARLAEPTQIRECELALDRLDRILQMDDNWTWETSADHTQFDPIWIAPYAHQLWSDVPRILLMSATLTRYSLELLGLSTDRYRFLACDNGWPLQNAPVYHLPTVKVNYHNTTADLYLIVSTIDSIIASRQDRKGLVHSVSYQRMHQILELSRYKHLMFSNTSSSLAPDAAKRFRAAKPPAILVSPSFASGWDFPYQQCEYSILPKVPWLPNVTRVVQERLKDTRYRAYCAALETVQMIGRSRRFADDRSESFLLDNHFPWLLSQARAYLPHRFKFHKITELPKLPPRCDRNYVTNQ